MQQTPVSWVKSSYSQMNGHCVEVANPAVNSVVVRDSKNPRGAVLGFAGAQWNAFIMDVRENVR